MNSTLIPTLLQIFNFSLLIGGLALTIIALIKLGEKKLPITDKTVWTIIILLTPILGSIAFFIIRPTHNNEKAGHFH
jgi:hypothetical protein